METVTKVTKVSTPWEGIVAPTTTRLVTSTIPTGVIYTHDLSLKVMRSETVGIPQIGFKSSVSGTSLTSIRVITLPDALKGVLKLNGVAVIVNQDIAPTDNGNLVFESTPAFAGTTTFTYSVRTSFGISATRTATIQAVTATGALIP